MKDYMIPIKDRKFDGVRFYRDEQDQERVEIYEYNNRGVELPGSDLGKLYDIIIYQEDSADVDRFSAILISPLDYVSRMIDCGFNGIVSVATTTSSVMMDDLYKMLQDGENINEGDE